MMFMNAATDSITMEEAERQERTRLAIDILSTLMRIDYDLLGDTVPRILPKILLVRAYFLRISLSITILNQTSRRLNLVLLLFHTCIFFWIITARHAQCLFTSKTLLPRSLSRSISRVVHGSFTNYHLRDHSFMPNISTDSANVLIFSSLLVKSWKLSILSCMR
jgi:hypothetical protein